MISSFLIILGLILLGFFVGKSFFRVVCVDSGKYSPVSVVWIGLGIWSCALLALALFRSISAIVYILPGAYVAIKLFENRKTLYNMSWNTRMIFPVVATVIASLYSLRVINLFDTWLYHMNAVNWMSTHGIVNGLGLLYAPLGYVDSWFALDASLNHGKMEGRVYTVTGALVLALMSWQSLLCINQLKSNNCGLSNIAYPLAFIMVLLVCWKSRLIASCTPDMAVIGLTLQIIHEGSRRLFGEADNFLLQDDTKVFLIAASIGFSFKLSFVGFAVLAGGLYAYQLWRNRGSLNKAAYIPVILSILILLICIGASLKATGWPFFPIPIGQWNLPWALTIDEVVKAQKDILMCARYGQNALTSETERFWILSWAVNKPTIAAFVLGTILSVIILSKEKTRVAQFLVALGLVGLTVFVWKAPDLRFGLGLFAGIIAVAACQLFRPLVRSAMKIQQIGIYNIGSTAALITLVILSALYMSPSECISRKLTRENQPSQISEVLLPLIPVTLTGSDIHHLSIAQFEEMTTRTGVRCSRAIDAPGHEGPGHCPGNHDLMSTLQLTTDAIAFLDPKRGPAGGFYRLEE